MRRRAARVAPSRRWNAGYGVAYHGPRRSPRRATARRAAILGTFVAALDLPTTPRLRAERTGSRVGHYTVWSDADTLLACVAWIVPAEEDEETR